jgi:hypothetical protein
MTASAGPVLKRLHRDFADRITFLTLYVREAHPGDRCPQAVTMEEKLRHAGDYKRRDGIPWPILVDDVEGGLHRELDPKPSAVYLVDEDGRVAFRALWSNAERPLRRGIERLLAGERPVGESTTRLVPMLGGMGMMAQTLALAGPQARRDVLTQAPPLWAMAKIAGLFGPLSSVGRGIAAVLLSTGALMATSLAVAAAIRRR